MIDYITILDKYLSKKRLNHCIQVANCASDLASEFNVNINDAFQAGLLHDISKEMNYNWQIDVLEEFNLEDEDFYQIPPIHHAYTAKKLLANLEVKPLIINAIENHVEGSADIDQLGMVLYIADFIEPGRRFIEAEYVRQLQGITLQEMYATCLVYSYNFLVKDGYVVSKKMKLAVEKFAQYAILENQ